MSLISVSNFVAPFRNTTHVVTLVLLAALFGAYRYSGGSISTASKRSPAPSVSVADDDFPPVTVVEEEDSGDSAQLLREMRRGGAQKNTTKGSSSDKLEAVEKQLGLR